MRRGWSLPAPRRGAPLLALRRALVLGLPSAAALLAAGCHTYRTVEDAPAGSVARLRVSIGSPTGGGGGRGETAAIEGLILSSGDTLRLVASTRQFEGAFREFVRRDTLRLARDDLASIEVRDLSVARSVALGAGIAAGTAALALAALGSESGEGGEGGEGGGGAGPQSLGAVISISVGAVRRLLGR